MKGRKHRFFSTITEDGSVASEGKQGLGPLFPFSTHDCHCTPREERRPLLSWAGRVVLLCQPPPCLGIDKDQGRTWGVAGIFLDPCGPRTHAQVSPPRRKVAGAVHFLLMSPGHFVDLGDTKQAPSVFPEARTLSFLSLGQPGSSHSLNRLQAGEPPRAYREPGQSQQRLLTGQFQTNPQSFTRTPDTKEMKDGNSHDKPK